MNDRRQWRIAQLRRRHPETRCYRDQLLLGAMCIDLVHGGAYAWAFLLRCGLPDYHVHIILREITTSNDGSIDEFEASAIDALASVGLSPPHTRKLAANKPTDTPTQANR